MKKYIVKPQTKGMVTIPNKIREKLKITPKSRIQVELDGDRIILTPLLSDSITFLDSPLPSISKYLLIKDQSNAPFGIDQHHFRGITLISGLPGNGKSVMIEKILREAINANKPIVMLDPYGGIISSTLKNLIPKKRKADIVEFEATRLNDNITSFRKEIDLKSAISENKILLVNQNSRMVGSYEAGELGKHILTSLLSLPLPLLSQVSLFVDEAHLSLTEQITNTLTSLPTPPNSLLAFDSIMSCNKEIRESLALNTNMLFAFAGDIKTYEFLEHHFSADGKMLRSLSKFELFVSLRYDDDSLFRGKVTSTPPEWI
jgi:bifunctional DNA-binding transcriptional regulator/antitoxin component of YhaV-PrlF toxin-antitoxin module